MGGELTVYIQVYLFIILYSYWIATNIIQYLSVFTQLYLRKWGQLLYQRIMQPFLRNTRTFMGEGGTPILRHGGKVPQWWPSFLWLSIQFGPYCIIRFTPSFCRKNQFVSITFSSRDTWTYGWSNLNKFFLQKEEAPYNRDQIGSTITKMGVITTEPSYHA